MSNDFDLIAIRHGRTAWNADGRFQGQTDVPLDETGREQARGLGRRLASASIARAVSSDLERARETAELVLAGRDVAIVTDPGWREMRFGAWEGLTWSEISERYPEAVADTTAAFPRPVDGESFDAVTERIAGAYARVRDATAPGETVLVATHAGPLHALLRVALGESEARALGVRFGHATYSRIEVRAGVARLAELDVAGDPPVAERGS